MVYSINKWNINQPISEGWNKNRRTELGMCFMTLKWWGCNSLDSANCRSGTIYKFAEADTNKFSIQTRIFGSELHNKEQTNLTNEWHNCSLHTYRKNTKMQKCPNYFDYIPLLREAEKKYFGEQNNSPMDLIISLKVILHYLLQTRLYHEVSKPICVM